MTESNSSAPRVVRHSKGKRPEFSDTPGVDQVMSMVLVLASEICVVRDRLDAVERIAAAKGLDLAAEIDRLPLDQTALEAREAWRQGLFRRLFYLLGKEAEELGAAETTERYKSVIDEIAKP